MRRLETTMSANGNTHDYDAATTPPPTCSARSTPARRPSFASTWTSASMPRRGRCACTGGGRAADAPSPQVPAPRRPRRRVMRACVESRPHAAGRARGSPRRTRVGAPARGLALAAGLAAAVSRSPSSAASSSRSAGPNRRGWSRASVIGSPGAAQLRISHSHAELVVTTSRRRPPGRIYEVWLKRGSTAPAPTSALFSVTAAGAADGRRARRPARGQPGPGDPGARRRKPCAHAPRR